MIGTPAPTAIAKVLIVEDQPRYIDELKRAFREVEKGVRFEVNDVQSTSEAEPYIDADRTDIYIVDLELPLLNETPTEKIGEQLVRQIVQRTNGGTIIYSASLRKDREDFLWGGVDDYIEKGDPTSYVVARSFAVWRRVQAAKRAEPKEAKKRQFRLGKWRLEPGNRTLVSGDGMSVRLSPTELAFVQYLCTIDAEIDRREFNVAVLGRPPYQEDKRIDNLVYRLREKLGDSVQLISRHDGGTYRLVDFEELSGA